MPYKRNFFRRVLYGTPKRPLYSLGYDTPVGFDYMGPPSAEHKILPFIGGTRVGGAYAWRGLMQLAKMFNRSSSYHSRFNTFNT